MNWRCSSRLLACHSNKLARVYEKSVNLIWTDEILFGFVFYSCPPFCLTCPEKIAKLRQAFLVERAPFNIQHNVRYYLSIMALISEICHLFIYLSYKYRYHHAHITIEEGLLYAVSIVGLTDCILLKRFGFVSDKLHSFHLRCSIKRE